MTEPAAPKEAPAEPIAAERRDEDGLPLDREATLDDVRGNEGVHARMAMGCTAIIVLLVLGFWILRGLVLG